MHRHLAYLSQTEKSGKSLFRIGKAWLERLVFPPVAGGGSEKHLLLSELLLPLGWQETASFASFTSQHSQATELLGEWWRAAVCHRQIMVKAVSVGAFLSRTDRLMSHTFPFKFPLKAHRKCPRWDLSLLWFFRKHGFSAFQREKSLSFRAELWSSAKGFEFVSD